MCTYVLVFKMKLITITRKKRYYQQIFDFNYKIAKFVDALHLENLPHEIMHSESLISQQICATNDIKTNYFDTQSISLFLASTSLKKLTNVFADVLILIIAQNKQLLLNGESYRILSNDTQFLDKLLSTSRRYECNVNVNPELFTLKDWQELSIKYLTIKYFATCNMAVSKRFALRFPVIKYPDLIINIFNQLSVEDLTILVKNIFKKRFQSIYTIMEEL